MSKKLKPTKGHEIGKIQDLRQLLDRAAEKYGDKIAFEYKKDATDKNSEIIVKTFNQFKKDAKKLSTIFLNMVDNPGPLTPKLPARHTQAGLGAKIRPGNMASWPVIHNAIVITPES